MKYFEFTDLKHQDETFYAQAESREEAEKLLVYMDYYCDFEYEKEISEDFAIRDSKEWNIPLIFRGTMLQNYLWFKEHGD